MKKLIVLFAVFGLLVAAQAESFLKNSGDRSSTYSVIWSNERGIGTGGTIDTLLGADKDTSTIFQLDNLQSLGAIFVVNVQQGAAHGIDTAAVLSCSLQVSIDGTNWVSLRNEPSFTHASSADPAGNVMIVWYAEGALGDSIIGDGNVAGPNSRAYIDAARLGRLVLIQTADNNDTSYTQVQVHLEYGQ
uniref:Uncharacterized protein n=1 Tax=viral metagenome TaxID=1070528 RepID=A0A6H1ZAD7_9ZZZZ